MEGLKKEWLSKTLGTITPLDSFRFNGNLSQKFDCEQGVFTAPIGTRKQVEDYILENVFSRMYRV